MQPARGTRRALAVARAVLATGRCRARDVGTHVDVLAEVLGVLLLH